MINKVGEAIIDELRYSKVIGNEVENLDEYILEEIQEAVGRVAIRAMMDPSDTMRSAGRNKIPIGYDPFTVYTPMIKQALKEKD